MNKSLKTKNRMKRRIIFIIISIIVIFKIIPAFFLSFGDTNKLLKLASKSGKDITDKVDSIRSKISESTIFDLLKYLEVEDNEICNFTTESDLLYVLDDDKYIVNVSITNSSDTCKYTIAYGIGDVSNEIEFNSETKKIEFKLKKEGKNECYIAIKKDGTIVQDGEWNKEIYYIRSYEKQFLDELDQNGISTHFSFKIDNSNSVNLLKSLGVKYIRDDILWKDIFKNNEYIFYNYDYWINNITDAGLKLIAILDGPGSNAGSNLKISNERELQNYVKYATEFAKRYPQVTMYEVWNEANYNWNSEDDCYWYARMVKELNKSLKSINKDIEIISGVTMTSITDSGNSLSSQTFFDKIKQYGAYKNSSAFSIHTYDIQKSGFINTNFYEKIISHKNLFNSFGGFTKKYVTEYGASTSTKNGMSEDLQASKLVEQSIILNNFDVDLNISYGMRNYGNDTINYEDNFGLLTYDYTPKKSYYALKNYYQNTNGAEYIGKINIQEGLEFHIYNKDGSPKAILWSDSTDKNITIDYTGLTAYDLYGNKIENTNGELVVSTSPVYLEGLNMEYYYKAISNVAGEKYNEYLQKYSEELSSSSKCIEIKSDIEKLKKYIIQLEEKEIINSTIAEQLMEMHYNIGTKLLEAYSIKELKIEDIKLASMLDALDDIGDSLEDLVTVTTTELKTNSIQNAQNKIDEYNEQINYSQDIDIVYPNKIIEFSQDFLEKANYINSLKEENDIKNGLIVSKSLHAYYLASWANDFINIYIDNYIKENPIVISYSEEECTNQDVTVTVKLPDNYTKITNNSGSNVYTFTENGKFIFNYTRRGREYILETKVNNIDKNAPIIDGVIANKIYLDETIAPIILDENISSIEVLINGRVLNDYKSGDELKEIGLYNIIAIDKAKNKTSIIFEIAERYEEQYIIKDNAIINIKQETDVKTFKDNLQIKSNYQVQRNGTKLNDEDIIATGDIIVIENSDSLLLSVAGDISQDGKVDLKDIVLLQKYLANQMELNEEQALAADINLDEDVNKKDLIKIRKILVNK